MSGFVAARGTDWKVGDEPEIAKRLGQLGQKLNVTIYGISGYRTPSHSVAVGGFANDPHTQGIAGDIGVNGQTRSSAGQLTDAQLASVGLYRPFPGANEINHVQLMPEAKQQMNAAKAPKDDGGGGVVGAVTGAAGAVGGAVSGAVDTVTDPVGAAKDAVTGVLNDLWNSIVSRAEYAGLFVVLLIAGAGVAVFGITRATGRRSQEATA
jgi:hypothetical protein